MKLSLIAAMEEDGGIGKDGRLPWHLRADMQLFRETTMGRHLIVGRITYESIGKPLAGRVMIVVTRDKTYHAPGCLIVHSIAEALALAQRRGETEAFVIGGAQIYQQTLALASCFHLTRVHVRIPCDVYFPPFDISQWQERRRVDYPADEQNDYPFTYFLLEKNQAEPTLRSDN